MKLHFCDQSRELIEIPITEPLLVRLTEDVGKLPAGFTYEVPRFEAERLIARRKAIAVGRLGTIADVVISEDDIDAALDSVTD